MKKSQALRRIERFFKGKKDSSMGHDGDSGEGRDFGFPDVPAMSREDGNVRGPWPAGDWSVYYEGEDYDYETGETLYDPGPDPEVWMIIMGADQTILSVGARSLSEEGLDFEKYVIPGLKRFAGRGAEVEFDDTPQPSDDDYGGAPDTMALHGNLWDGDVQLAAVTAFIPYEENGEFSPGEDIPLDWANVHRVEMTFPEGSEWRPDTF